MNMRVTNACVSEFSLNSLCIQLISDWESYYLFEAGDRVSFKSVTKVYTLQSSKFKNNARTVSETSTNLKLKTNYKY